MSSLDPVSEEFSAYKASVSRLRWFLTTAVLISVLIMLHVYLERLSFQDAQFRSEYARRISNYSEVKLECYKERAVQLQKKVDGLKEGANEKCVNTEIPVMQLNRIMESPREEIIQEYGQRAYHNSLINNTLREMKFPTRHIPILGVEVPANDFATVMAIMSLVFVVGLWVNLRGISASLRALSARKNPELMKLAALNTVFVSVFEAPKRTLARGIRSVVLWMPFTAIFAATIQNAHSVSAAKGAIVGFESMITLHLAIATTVTLLHLWIAIECKYVVRDIDAILSTPQQQQTF